jgi:hypothetical protein
MGAATIEEAVQVLDEFGRRRVSVVNAIAQTLHANRLKIDSSRRLNRTWNKPSLSAEAKELVECLVGEGRSAC